LPGDKRILADYSNDKVKLVNLDTATVTADIKIPSSPWGITSISEDEVAVTVPGKKKILFVKVTDLLRLDRELPVERGCSAVLHIDGNLFVSYAYPCKIETMSLHGTKRKMFHFEFIKWPEYMDLSQDNNAIYISDFGEGVTRLSLDGTVEATYKDEKLSGPSGIVGVGPQGRLLMCGYHTCNIHLLEPDLTKGNTLLQEDARLKCLSFCHSTCRLYVGLVTGDVKVFQL